MSDLLSSVKSDKCHLLSSDGTLIMSDMRTTKTPTYTLGENIRKAREDMGWKQSDLAVRVKTSRAAIAGWENNTHRPSALALDKIAELTGYPVEFFDPTGGKAVSTAVPLRELPGNWSEIEPRTLLKLAA